MLDEISVAVIFLVRLIEKSANFNQEQLEGFKQRLSELLMKRFQNHWFPETPARGQAYRCIRVNEFSRRDAVIEEAASACGFNYDDMKLPVELTLWVDPNEVCCRFGENKGSYCTLASFSDKENSVAVDSKSLNAMVDQVMNMITEEKPAKAPVVPLSSNNQKPSGGRRQNGNKQKMSRKGNQMGGMPHNGYHHPMHWYSLLAPHWMPPSHQPPFHPILGKWTPQQQQRYNSWNSSKSLVKV
ncbi:unnamed protein product [Bemisia tabaci]|uniref:Anti-proliferative protein domain-containing protein n=1 Tax=Bemisia tabaci TaxID=7038 RepID=A0A9P0F5L5_BEMTA|nr:PREDICTED: protein BTG2-like [Bemisia tabaci]CAH0392943.1 unnamed protein product [Bemisia tabaci]